MPRKLTKKRFLSAVVENEEGKKDCELAVDLDITPEHFSRLKSRYRTDIVEACQRYTEKISASVVRDLKRQSEGGPGNSTASRTLLEMAGAYTPSQKHLGDRKSPLTVLVLPERDLEERQTERTEREKDK